MATLIKYKKIFLEDRKLDKIKLYKISYGIYLKVTLKVVNQS